LLLSQHPQPSAPPPGMFAGMSLRAEKSASEKIFYGSGRRGRNFYPQALTASRENAPRYGEAASEATVGRYISSDPIGLTGGLNTFGYAAQNPVMRIDPQGLQSEPGLAACTLGPNPVCVASTVATCVKWVPIIVAGVTTLVCASGEVDCTGNATPSVVGPMTPIPPSATEDHSVEICKEGCDAGYEAEKDLCQMMQSPKNRAICYQEAMGRYSVCLANCGK